MQNTSSVPAIIAAILFGLAAWAPAAEPADAYRNATVLCQDGMKAMEEGRHEAAVGKLRAAQTLIQKISQSEPHWQPALVAYRLLKIENALKEMGTGEGPESVVNSR
ncbi:hypothetical protein [Prosthecobacter sp.]|uniref:hypothetical protein n=1 Tax=Prosthecobacter sp. TaxID=1965333 RepID=UPI0037835A49